MNDSVRYTREGALARITLATPDNGNALNTVTAPALLHAAEALVADVEGSRARACLVDAEGPFFCVGGDLADFAVQVGRDQRLAEVAGTSHAALKLIHSLQIPVVSSVQGVAAGGGIGLALIADIVYVSDRAKFRLAYTSVGLSPDCGATWHLPLRIGGPRAAELALTNRLVGPNEAVAWGMASRVVPHDSLADEALHLATSLVSGPTTAFARSKALMRGEHHDDFCEHLDLEAASIAELAESADGRAGIDAFLTKTTPSFGQALRADRTDREEAP